MNDSLRSDIFVRHPPETIACACIYLAARLMQISLPKSPSWYEAFRISEADIEDAAFRILSLYARAKVNEDSNPADKLWETLFFPLSFAPANSRKSVTMVVSPLSLRLLVAG